MKYYFNISLHFQTFYFLSNHPVFYGYENCNILKQCASDVKIFFIALISCVKVILIGIIDTLSY